MSEVTGSTIGSGPRLLVSVRNAREAADALAGGADMIDVKEPARGSLGAADREEVDRVLSEVGARRPVSVACGELVDVCVARFAVPRGTQFVKFGLSRCGEIASWRHKLGEILLCLPADVQLVPVAYADWETAESPEPWQVLDHAAELGCRTLLIDTYMKVGVQLFDCWSFAHVVKFVRATRAHGMAIALAGGLRNENLVRAVDTGADIVGVRGAVCDVGREGTLQAELVQSARRLMAGTASLRFAPVS